MRRLQRWVVCVAGWCLLGCELAGSPPLPDPWRVTRLQIDGAQVPPGVRLAEKPPLEIAIHNQSGLPLQIEVPAGCGRTSWITVEPGGRQTASLAGVARGFEARDEPPVGVQTRPPDLFELRVLHGETTLTVPLVIEYELNPYYRPGVSRPTRRSLSPWGPSSASGSERSASAAP